jgi:ribonuclease HI
LSKLLYRAWTDGASRGNPGPAAIGVSIEDASGTEVASASETIGVATNNEAEYRALIRALDLLGGLGAEQAEISLDSELIVRQLLGRYRVRNPRMKTLYDRAQALASRFAAVDFRHVPREENARADQLANDALDRQL